MCAKNKRPQPATPAPAAPAATEPALAGTEEPFYQRHPKVANVIYAALWVYVAMLWLLALDQWFHWGIFGPKIPPVP